MSRPMTQDSTLSPQAPNTEPHATGVVARYGELDLFGLGMLLLRNWKIIIGCGLAAFLVMLVMMLQAKPRYASTAVMIVPQGNPTAAALSARLAAGSLDLLGGGFELYSDIMKSRTLADRLIERHDLMQVYRVKRMNQAEGVLASLTHIEVSREGVLRVTVQDTSPQRAADLANDYLRQLDLLNSNLVLTSVGQERAYLERELVKEKNALADAEVALKEVQEKTSGMTPDVTANSAFSAITTTRAELRAAQIRLASLLTGETEQNPEVVRLRSEIAGLTSQLQQLQTGSNSEITGTSTSKVPEQTLEYTRRFREAKFHEQLFELLEKQFSDARLQEAKTPQIVQVLDPAVPSDGKAWPPRTFYCVAAGVLGMVAGLFFVLARALIVSYAAAPRNHAKLQELRHFFRSLLPGSRMARS